MRGVKYQILGLGIILLGMTVPSFSHISYICGALGFGLAVIGCFPHIVYMRSPGIRAGGNWMLLYERYGV